MALASAVAAIGVTAVGVSPASAATVTLDHGFLKVALPDPFEIITTTTGPVVLDNFNPDPGGDYAVATTDVTFPIFTGEALPGVAVSVDFHPKPGQSLTGNYNAATGALTGNTSNWEAEIVVGEPPDDAPCAIATIPLTLSTATNSVFEGNAFDPGPVPTNGAVSDDWTALEKGVGDGCGIVDSLTASRGGLWLSNGVAEPTFVPEPPPDDGNNTPPPTKKKKCKKKKGKKGASAAKKSKCKKKKKKK